MKELFCIFLQRFWKNRRKYFLVPLRFPKLMDQLRFEGIMHVQKSQLAKN